MSVKYAHWACKDIGNFGDMITPYILNKLGYEAEFSWMQGVVLDGSILGVTKENMVIFGAGFMNITDKCESKDIRYVRGSVTKELLRLNGFDVTNVKTHIPAFCLSEFIPDKTPSKEKEYALHYIDYSGFGIDVCKPVETVVNQILDHNFIITSSLHAYIISRMYGRGCALVKTSQPISGDGMKYIDAFSTMNEPAYIPFDINDAEKINSELHRTYKNPIKYDNTQFLNDLKQYLCQ